MNEEPSELPTNGSAAASICPICGKPLATEECLDDENLGDAHTRCIYERGEG